MGVPNIWHLKRKRDEIVYKDIPERAERELGIKTIYSLTDAGRLPAHWAGLIGWFNTQWILQYVPGYKNYVFYISGPNKMVDTTRALLRQLGIQDSQIKVDYFSGLA